MKGPADPGTAEKVLATASRLFYANGVHAVGIDWIVAEAGVAKTSLYRHFETKDALIAAFLEREDREFWQQWAQTVAPAADPLDELMNLLTWIGKRISRDGYRGCPQINVAAEFADLSHPARVIRRRHKHALLERLTDIVRRIGTMRPDDVAMQLALLIDGAFTSDGRLSKIDAVRILKNGALALLGSARKKGLRSRAGSIRQRDAG